MSFMDGLDRLSKTHYSIILFRSGGELEITTEGDNSIGVAIYEDCTFLYSGFPNVKSDYCRREANKIVHILAYDQRILPILWERDPPTFILAQLVYDITIV
jgi:hypothetical protein